MTQALADALSVEAWLNDLAAGDQVIVIDRWIARNESLQTVERTTKTMIIVDGLKFHRSGGRRVGANHHYHPQRLVAPTPERLAKIAQRRMVARIDQAFSSDTWRHLPIAKLEVILAQLTA